MNHEESLSKRRKRERDYGELSRLQRKLLDKEIDNVAQFLLDLWEWKQEQKKKAENPDNGSSPVRA